MPMRRPPRATSTWDGRGRRRGPLPLLPVFRPSENYLLPSRVTYLCHLIATLAAANTAESGLIVWPREPHHVGTSRALAFRVHSQCRLSHSRMRHGRAVFARPRCLSQYAHLSTSIHTARLYTTLTWDHTGTNMFEFRIPVVCVCGYTIYTYIRYNLLYTILIFILYILCGMGCI